MNNSKLLLNLVFNPQGASLPPPQSELEQEYKKYLSEQYNIKFNNLLVITNLPIARFGGWLLAKNEFDNYMKLLRDSYSADNLENLMCKYLLSVDWQGNIYDCDFNQMLKMSSMGSKKLLTIKDLNQSETIADDIMVAGHCYGCTAGQGSSCSGALN